MTECSDIQPLLSAFHDGELDPHEMLDVARHTAGCVECDATLAAYGVVGSGLREADIAESPEWFVASVMARVERLRPSRLARFGEYLSGLNERLGAGFSLATAAVAVAALTAIIVTPYVHRLETRNETTPLASADRIPTDGSTAVKELAQNDVSNPAEAANASHTVISRLEAKNPAVAVWSEPRTDTTVIWLPDRHQ